MLNIYAPINVLGYGIHAVNLIKGLKDKGEEYNLTPIGQLQVDPYFEPYVKEGLDNRIKFDAKSPSVFIFHDEFSNQACGNKLYTFSVFETDIIPELNKAILTNGPTDVVLTTTERHKMHLEDNGIKKPIEVVNEGVDTSLYNTIPYDPIIDTGKFTYITVGKREVRKNTDLLVETWINEMKDKEAALIAHTFNHFIHKDPKAHPFTNLSCWLGLDPRALGLEYKGFNGKAHHFTNGNCDVYFTAPGIPLTSMPGLYHSANVGIQVSRGEGWDLPMTELMACGIPCIATDCLGHLEYFHAAPGAQQELKVPLTGYEVANDDMWFKGDKGQWGTIDTADLRDKISYTYENREKYEEKSDELADYIEECYGWERAAQKLVEVAEKYQ